MKWIKGQIWCLAGAAAVALVMTAFYFCHPTSHGFRGMLIGSCLVVGAATGLKAGFLSIFWVAYSYAASFLFGVAGIQPFASHDVPPSVVAAFYSLYAVPAGLTGSIIGAALRSVRKRRNKDLANPAHPMGSSSACHALQPD